MITVRKCALLLIRDKKLLLSREHGDTRFISLGGRYEGEENDFQCLQRELLEEVNTKAKEDTLKFLGEFEYSDGPDKIINIRAYAGELENEPKPVGEVEELRWFGRKELETTPEEILTMITKRRILPFLMDNNLV